MSRRGTPATCDRSSPSTERHDMSTAIDDFGAGQIARTIVSLFQGDLFARPAVEHLPVVPTQVITAVRDGHKSTLLAGGDRGLWGFEQAGHALGQRGLARAAAPDDGHRRSSPSLRKTTKKTPVTQ